VAGVGGAHHVLGVKLLLRQLGHGQRAVLLGATGGLEGGGGGREGGREGLGKKRKEEQEGGRKGGREGTYQGGEADHEEVEAGEGDHVHGQLF